LIVKPPDAQASVRRFYHAQGGMMPALNRVQLIGYLGRDPESKFTPTGKRVCHFSMGVTQRWKAAGETKEYTDWFNIEAWGRLGEISQEYLKKGSLVFVEGRLKTDKYEDKGETKYYTKVVALSLQFLDRKPAEEPMLSVDENAAEYEA
jgi:single-strand DNA-binding protein